MEYRRLRDIVVEDLGGDSALCDSLEYCSAKGRTVIFNNKDTDVGILYDLVADQYNKKLNIDAYLDDKTSKYFSNKYLAQLSIEQYEEIRKGLAVIYKSLPDLKVDTIEHQHFISIIEVVTMIMTDYWKKGSPMLFESFLDYPRAIQEFLIELSRNAIDVYYSNTDNHDIWPTTTEFAGCAITHYERLFCHVITSGFYMIDLPFSAAFIARILEMTNAKLFEHVEKNDVSREAIK